jgi:hypothetical protein
MPITPARSWLALLALAGLIIAAAVWGATSMIPSSAADTATTSPCVCATPSPASERRPIDLLIPGQ